MKKKVLLLLVLLMMPIFVLHAEDDVVTFEDDVVSYEDDILIAPSPIQNDTTEGSQFMAGTSVAPDGTINGILFAAGESLSISGYNEYGLYAGNRVIVNANIGKDLFVAGNIVSMSTNANIARDLYVAANAVTINGNIGGKVKAAANSIVISDAYINGDVVLSANSIVLGDNITINGNISYNKDATVEGLNKLDSNKVSTYEEIKGIEYERTTKDILVSKISSICSLIILALVINALFPKIYKSIDKKITTKKVFSNMGIGFIALIAIPIASVIAMLTGIGVGVGLLALAVYIICLFLCILIPMVLIGNIIVTKVFKLKDKTYLSILFGVLVVELFSMIPLIGGLCYFLLMLIGLGYIKELMFPKKA